jgi:hypothetical protein
MMNPFDDETFFVKDLGSANGTCINGELLKSGMVHSLHSGDALTIGTLHMIVTFMPATTADIKAYEHTLAGTEKRDSVMEHTYASQLPGGDADRNATLYRRSTLHILEHLSSDDQGDTDPGLLPSGDSPAGSTWNSLTPDERNAVTMLREIVHAQELGEDILFYIARDAVHNPYWRVNQRIAVLQVAASYGYVEKENAELIHEQRRMNRIRFGGSAH